MEDLLIINNLGWTGHLMRLSPVFVVSRPTDDYDDIAELSCMKTKLVLGILSKHRSMID